MNTTNTSHGPIDLLAKHWLSILLTALGLFAITIGTVNQQRVAASKNWPSVSGTVTKASIVTTKRRRRARSNRIRTKQLPEIQFSYQVADVEISNRQRYFAESSPARVIRKYPVGSTVSVTYDPSNQSDSFIEPPTPSNVPTGMGALLLTVAGAMTLVPKFVRKAKQEPPRKRPNTIGEISSVIGQDVRELKISGWTDQQISALITKKLAESQP